MNFTDRVHMRCTLRTIPTVLMGARGTIIVAAILLLVPERSRNSSLTDKVLQFWARSWLFPVGVRLQVEGRKHLKPRPPYAIVANHQSILDALVCLLALGFHIRILTKRELFRMPMLGSALWALLIAFANGIPVLPVIIDGTRSVWMPGSNMIRGGQV